MLRVDILTLFPDYFRGPLEHGTLSRAVQAGHLTVTVHQLRNWAEGKHRVTDDYTFGGGTGMVMKPDPFFRAVADLRTPQSRVILLSPSGRLLTQQGVVDLSAQTHLILLCGRYEGVDERVARYLADDEVSIGDYVVSGGELPALVLLDATVRQLPGVIGGGPEAVRDESHSTGSWSIRSIRDPRLTRIWQCRKSCFQAITGALNSGGANSHSCARVSGAPIC